MGETRVQSFVFLRHSTCALVRNYEFLLKLQWQLNCNPRSNSTYMTYVYIYYWFLIISTISYLRRSQFPISYRDPDAGFADQTLSFIFPQNVQQCVIYCLQGRGLVLLFLHNWFSSAFIFHSCQSKLNTARICIVLNSI